MTDMPRRDTTGKCDEGECNDRVLDGQIERQIDISLSEIETPASYPDAKWARSGNEHPVFGEAMFKNGTAIQRPDRLWPVGRDDLHNRYMPYIPFISKHHFSV